MTLSNFVALKRWEIKEGIILSGKMGDYFSNFIFGIFSEVVSRTVWDIEPLTTYCIDRLMAENKFIFKKYFR